MALQSPTCTNVVPLLPGEADALHRATCHVLAEALRCSADQIAPSAEEPDLAQCAITLGAVDRARALLDELTDHPDEVTAPPAYLRALVVQALSFHLEERAFLCPPHVEALDAVERRMMAALPALGEAPGLEHRVRRRGVVTVPSRLNAPARLARGRRRGCASR
jgi:hypothetical protein